MYIDAFKRMLFERLNCLKRMCVCQRQGSSFAMSKTAVKKLHWRSKVQESFVPLVGSSGDLGVAIGGGADYGEFPFVTSAPGGGLTVGDLILEIGGTPVLGMTLGDVRGVLNSCPHPIRIKTVSPGSTLCKDLRLYLSKCFTPGSVDSQLQQVIRENLYLRAVPCTTRQPRDGEISGVDYNFVSVEEFFSLEESGALLESGKFKAASLLPHRFVTVRRGSPAARSGQIRPGDRLEAVEGQSVVTLPHRELAHILRRAGNTLRLTIIPRPSTYSSSLSESTDYDPGHRGRKGHRSRPKHDSKYYSVDLDRGPTGFGFSLRGGSEYNMGLYVLGLMEGGPASLSHRMQVSDQLVEINGDSTVGMTHSQAVEQIRRGGHRIHLVLKRGNGYVPDYGREHGVSSPSHRQRPKEPSVAAVDPAMARGRSSMKVKRDRSSKGRERRKGGERRGRGRRKGGPGINSGSEKEEEEEEDGQRVERSQVATRDKRRSRRSKRVSQSLPRDALRNSDDNATRRGTAGGKKRERGRAMSQGRKSRSEERAREAERIEQVPKEEQAEDPVEEEEQQEVEDREEGVEEKVTLEREEEEENAILPIPNSPKGCPNPNNTGQGRRKELEKPEDGESESGDSCSDGSASAASILGISLPETGRQTAVVLPGPWLTPSQQMVAQVLEENRLPGGGQTRTKGKRAVS
ncbi:membrane-associated guanylate kinase, WW and PDZ domain-containing protein 3-like [Lampris incognitus]|uniref:membrane-associated guanylate kinase, WW and PDZ domain-containing protein 3-like n=1 Tax=Lampris incognitus TaxID=2546036 RepID=UPI0024B4C29B|nr:membrane-associated guanylate kinase, WW and PDZ domain-containing protein 3-like [Lampris incognitus]